MCLYVFFFIVSLFADKIKSTLFRKIFLLCFYLFFCFGYTTGSDWRAYELDYVGDFAEVYSRPSANLYVLYNAITTFFAYIGVDFWLYTGLCKCVFLYAVISVIKLFTPKYFAILAILLPSNLLFMLVDCPFKFMMALTFILFAFKSLIKGAKTKAIVLFGLSLFVHFATFGVVAFLILGWLCRKVILRMKVVALLILLAFFMALSTSLTMFTSLTSTLSSFIPIMEQKLISYSVESVDGWFTLGTLMNVFIFCILCYSRNYILQLPHGDYLFPLSILYGLLFPICLIIPTGFRLNMFNMIMCEIAIGAVCFKLLSPSFVKLRFRPIIFVIMLLYYSYSYINDIDGHYVYLPYSNSIPYIVNGTSADNYYNRSKVGYNNYLKRKGVDYYSNRK